MGNSYFERYTDAVVAYESGLVTAAYHLFSDLYDELSKDMDVIDKIGPSINTHNVPNVDLDTNSKTEFNQRYMSSLILYIAEVMISLKMYQKAIDLLNKSQERDPTNIRLLEKLFLIYKDLSFNETLAIDTFMKMQHIINLKGPSCPDYSIYKASLPSANDLITNNNSYMLINYKTNMFVRARQNLTRQLPMEVMNLLLSYLDTKSLFNMSLVCKEWRNVILESPALFGSYFTNSLDLKKLLTFYRMFSQHVDMSDVLLPQLIINNNSLNEELLLFKALFGWKIRTRRLIYEAMNDFPPMIRTLADASNSRFFLDLVELSLNTKTLLPAIRLISMTQSLKILSLKLKTPFTKTPITSIKDTLKLPELQKLNLICSSPLLDRHMCLLAANLETPKLTSLSIDVGNCVELLLLLLKNCKNLKSLTLYHLLLPQFFHLYLYSEDTLIPEMKVLSSLKIFTRSSWSNPAPPIGLPKRLSSLRSLTITNPLLTRELFRILDSCCLTLEELTLYGPSFIYDKNYDNDSNKFSLKRLFDKVISLKVFKIDDKKCTTSEFDAMIKEIIAAPTIYALKYFSFVSGSKDGRVVNNLLKGIMREDIKIDTIGLDLPVDKYSSHLILAVERIKNVKFEFIQREHLKRRK